MIVTDKFVLLNLPKTGSTFARTVIKKLLGYEESVPNNRILRQLYLFYQRRLLASGALGFREWQVRSYLPTVSKLSGTSWLHLNPHKPWSELPAKYRDLPVVTIARDPLEMAISGLHYGFLQQNIHHIDGVPVRRLFPNFPELDFAQYLDLHEKLAAFRLKRHEVEPQTHIGYLSIQFIKLVFRKPRKALAKMSSEYLANREFVADMPPKLHLLRNESLKEDLADFLTEVGYPDTETRFIRNYPRVNESSYSDGRGNARKAYVSEELEQRFRADEHVFYTLLGHYGLNY